MTSDGIHSYTYDAEGNVTEVDGGGTGQYVYDALNRRVRVQNSSGTNEYLFDYAGRRTSTWIVSNNFGSEGRIYWGGQQIAYRAYDGNTYFEHQDITGTERVRTDYTGATAVSYYSLPWGDGYTATTPESQSNQDNLHFATLDQDAESGTSHATFRQASTTLGRWMSPDPYSGNYDATNPQSMNRYNYVLNNPLAYVDPDGTTGPCVDTGSGCEYPCPQGTCVWADPPPPPPPPTPPPPPGPCDDVGACTGSPAPPTPGSPGGQSGGPGGNGSSPTGAPNKSTICTPVFCPANDTPSPTPPDPKKTACAAEAQAAQNQFAKNPKTFLAGAGASRILSTVQNSRLPGGSPLTWLKGLGGLEALYLTWAGNDALNQAFYDTTYRACMAR
jgi:RHS repeat-associated protein